MKVIYFEGIYKMILTNKIAKYTISFIRKNTSSSEDDLEKISYGIKVIVSNFFKLVILFFTAHFLGILNYTILAIVSFAILRTFACGVHANSTIQCIIFNYLFFLGNVFLSINYPLSNNGIIVIFVASFILLCLYAPADTAERPLINKNLRRFLKIFSIIVASALFVISLLINNSIYKSIIIYSIFEEAIAITPFLYNFFGKSYRNYSNITL